MNIKLVNKKITHDWVDELLLERGVDTLDLDKIKTPSLDELEAPWHLDNIEKAAEVILAGIKAKAKFGLLIDCD